MKKRIISFVLAVCLLVSMVPSMGVRASAADINEVTRLAGENRFLTAIAVADAMKDKLEVDKFNAVIVASGTSFADALSGSYLAAVKNAPILLSCNEDFDASLVAKYTNIVVQYIKENLAEDGIVYILGGAKAVAPALDQALTGYNVCRLAGSNRFETNIMILEEAGVEGKDVLVCNSDSFADSLSASAAKLPILLVNSTYGIFTVQEPFLENCEEDFYIIGGETAVSTKMEGQIGKYGETTRIGGKNRFETSVLIAEAFFDDPSSVVLAYAWNFPDGLCGGGLAAAMDAPLILTMDRYEVKAREYIQSETIDAGFVLGSNTLISDDAVELIFTPAEDPSEPTMPPVEETEPSTEPEITYIVTFLDYNGNVLKKETVAEGDCATAPTDPEREGYTFVGWSGSFEKVTEDLVLIAQYDKVLETNQYNITYVLTNNDAYLTQYLTENTVENKNPEFYTSGTALRLVNLKNVPGYTFDGWYDGAGANAEQIKEISADEAGDIELYAHWTLEEFTITFHNTYAETPDSTYTVNKVTSLTDPYRFGYVFTGWITEGGNLVTEIPKGTTGNIALYANWTSERNRTFSEPLENPIIHEDTENGVYLFVYKIGRIENVPLDTIHDFGYNAGEDGVKWELETQKEVSISSEQADTIANMISNATTNTSAWTLSSEWSDTFEFSETHANEVSEETIKNNQVSFSETGTYSIGGDVGGSSTITDKFGGSVKLSAEANVGAEVGVKDAGSPITGKLSAGLKVGSETEVHYDKTLEREAHWNINEGYEASKTVSASKSVTNSIGKKISDVYSIGQSSTEGGGESLSSELATTQAESREYSSAFTYSNSTTQIETTKYTSPEVAGHFRIVAAGTIHVFAVVGYDVASSSYFVYTFSIMDDAAPKQFMDYSSTTSQYNDEENGALPFEVPYFVNEYIESNLTTSIGLTVEPESGIITDFYGESKNVIVPEYLVVESGNGSNEAVRITGISANAFAGNPEITSVTLPDAVTSIPASAFSGCTSLKKVTGASITNIGANAFKGCTSLEAVELSTAITSLGNNAYKDVPKLTVTACNAAVAQAAVVSGAKDITIRTENMTDTLENVVLVVPDTAERFSFDGAGKTFTGVRVVSDAASTIISNASFVGCTDIPLVLGSDKVTLSKVVAESPSLVMQLTASDTVVFLYGTVTLNSSGANVMLTNNVSLELSNANVTSKLKVDGNVVVCGELEGEKLLSVTNGNIIYSTGDAFTVSFDANGGTVGEISRLVPCSQPIGELPVPTRDFYTFIGWFDSAEGGQEITQDSSWVESLDVTLYAQWKQNEVSGWILASEAPSDVELVDTKWTYTLTTTTESKETSLEGYTQIGSRWVESGNGSINYASFPNGFDTSHWIYTSFQQQALSPYENETSKREVSNNWGGYVYWHWMYDGVPYAETWERTISLYPGAWDLYGNAGTGYYYSVFYALTSQVNCPYLDNYYCCSQYVPSYYCHAILPADKTGIGTPRFFRFEYSTSNYIDYSKLFTYQKTEEKESATEIIASKNVSNIQKWVQFRAK